MLQHRSSSVLKVIPVDDVDTVTIAEIGWVQNTKFDCRICLQDIGQRKNVYCGCKGFNQYVHEACLYEWLSRATSAQDLKNGVKKCQICQQNIKLKVDLSCKLNNCKEIEQALGWSNFVECPTQLLVVTIIFLTSFTLLAFSIGMYKIVQQYDFVIIIAIAVFSTVSGLCVLYFIWRHLIGWRRVMVGILQRKN